MCLSGCKATLRLENHRRNEVLHFNPMHSASGNLRSSSGPQAAMRKQQRSQAARRNPPAATNPSSWQMKCGYKCVEMWWWTWGKAMLTEETKPYYFSSKRGPFRKRWRRRRTQQQWEECFGDEGRISNNSTEKLIHKVRWGCIERNSSSSVAIIYEVERLIAPRQKESFRLGILRQLNGTSDIIKVAGLSTWCLRAVPVTFEQTIYLWEVISAESRKKKKNFSGCWLTDEVAMSFGETRLRLSPTLPGRLSGATSAFGHVKLISWGVMLYKKNYVGQGFVGMAPKGSGKRDKVRVMAPTWAPVKGAGGRCGQAIWAVARDWPLLLPKGSVAEARGNKVEKAMDLGNMGVKLKNESEESESESEQSESESSSDEDIDEDAKLLKELDRLHAEKEHTEEHKEEKTEEQSVPSIPLILMPKHCGKDLATGYKLCK
ncbi:hypothetical protein SELMODRAFT_424295 [Selaginella moellendorffii]|uniref:Uncharacterized protein n=1 Tax=Selaginella moellendorffii TaxID=88036 RepID=D8SPF3_SELML|nr:hypothetical protein SELMODRAFT_424295 [Selaginella moellendorffii]